MYKTITIILTKIELENGQYEIPQNASHIRFFEMIIISRSVPTVIFVKMY